MAKMLRTKKEVYEKLYKAGLITFSKPSFSEAVKIGKIPFVTEEGVKHKLYEYDAVAKAIKDAGIGKPRTMTQKLDNLPPPTKGQDKEEYGSLMVDELGEKPTLTDANIYKTLYTGKLEKLKYEKEVGTLIEKEQVEDKAFTVARTIRDKILSIPERMSNELASIDDAHTIKELLYKEFEILLDGFSKDSFI